MSERRRQVFVEKVLKKLFPNVSSSQEKETPGTLTSETPLKKVTSEGVKYKHVHHLTDGSDIKAQPHRHLYTVSLPPEGHVPFCPAPSTGADSETACSADDAEDQDPHDQPKKRIRKHKLKKKFKNSNNVRVDQAELEEQQSLLQEKLQPQHTDGPTISKNRKRKLKKKQQIRRKKAAGLVTKAFSASFTYQPEENGSEQEDVPGAAGDGGPRAMEEARGEAITEHNTAPSQEDEEIANRKAGGILNFLKLMQEMYFYDGVSKDMDSAVRVETAEELLRCLESHRMAPSDVLILDHMKTLLLLHDTARLQRALELLPEHCEMPLGESCTCAHRAASRPPVRVLLETHQTAEGREMQQCVCAGRAESHKEWGLHVPLLDTEFLTLAEVYGPPNFINL
ncbi:glutamate-rich protein 1 isoform X3 [Heterocephalus glaber]|uniref:Glutamate-rich protein 1 isoform X3 n=1 Tax=Heterocephalus glaber TaxID=10181 RepID=A0AAX6Q991_HETGA|nr:glutamate-rich protein 1 isoform X3 [Heterocephalus glaber]